MNEKQLKEYICDLALLDELDSDEPLFSGGIIDSVSLLDLVVYVEKQCGIKVAPAELTLENWDSVQAILNFAGRARSA